MRRQKDNAQTRPRSELFGAFAIWRLLSKAKVGNLALELEERLQDCSEQLLVLYGLVEVSVSALTDKAEVDEGLIRVFGRTDAQEQTVGSGINPSLPGALSFVRKWRTRQDSNLRPSPSEGDTLSS